jgi:phosphoribosylamine---glycine ligase
MRVLVIGGGAREHALVARLSSEAGLSEVVCVPGNPGIAAQVRTIAANIADPDELLRLADSERIDFTVVGPEVPLSAGVADRFAAHGRLLFGPTQAAARLESSKAFAKAFMTRHGVPTARFETCDSLDSALRAIRSNRFGFPVVLKADGLAAGKGVAIAEHLADAEAAVRAAMTEQRFGTAGQRLVIEEYLHGPEVSFFVISDGVRAISIGTAQDHKRIFDDDRGPNTGGMGAFAPSPLVDDAIHRRVMSDIVAPVIEGMAAEGHSYRGVLYVGLMLTATGPQVIEFNVRFGDPEAQVILPLIEEPLLPLLISAASGTLDQPSCRLATQKLVGVVLASRGYPDSAESGQPITGVEDAERETGVTVFHAGTALRHGQLVTAGGRVMTVVAHGASFADAIARAYAGVDRIHFDGMQYRRDIGRKALETKSATTEDTDSRASNRDHGLN